jgi:CDP-diacylglycerol--glycerol-3-phosphate 3-phosphatidyltransferase
MTLADKVTTVRLVLAPIFCAVYVLSHAGWTVPVLWAIFIVAELNDLLDGKIARKRGETTDFGKLFDPFADTLARITYFFLFVLDGLLPAAGLLIVLWREFAILFVRNLMLRKGVAMGARWSGKVKAVAYMVAGVFALLASSVTRLASVSWGITDVVSWFDIFHWAGVAVFVVSIVLSITSFFEYVAVYRSAPLKNKS